MSGLMLCRVGPSDCLQRGCRGAAPQLVVVDSLFMGNTAVNGAGVFVQK